MQDYGGHSSQFHHNLVVVMPYDGSNCINVAEFKPGLGHKYFNNTCVSGAGQYSEPYGCGSPVCANSSRPAPDMDKVGGASQCQPEFFETWGNQYYSPHGNASMSCGGRVLGIKDVQAQFKNEVGSTFGALPDPGQILMWAQDVLGWEAQKAGSGNCVGVNQQCFSVGSCCAGLHCAGPTEGLVRAFCVPD